ncbi:MAG: CpaF family protein, partial [Actinobacteria bacterium]|nr:CpaF family protein [Actinomycetota bacterium]
VNLRDDLRKALYERLSTETIAALVREDRDRAKREITAALDLQLRAPEFSFAPAEQKHRAAQDVVDMMLGFGPIERLLDDPLVTEIMVNSSDSVFYEREGRIHKSDVVFADDDQVRMIIDRIVAPLGRRVDEQSPIVSARLPQGHRVNVIIPPLSLDGPVLTIRKFRAEIYTLTELVEMHSLSEPLGCLLSWAVRSRKNIAVAGGTGGGKTTLLNALSCEIDPSERIITIEDSAELKFSRHPHVVRLEARQKNAEGQGEVSIRELVINALRMRPDRIVVGECRGEEALDMLQAMNTGHDGSMTTLHANTPAEVVARLIMMARFGLDLPVDVIEAQIASALDLIVQQDRFADGSRHVTAVVSCSKGAEGVELETVARWDRVTKSYHYEHVPSWLDELPFLGIASNEEVAQWRLKTG